jgi:hypothetical protein
MTSVAGTTSSSDCYYAPCQGTVCNEGRFDYCSESLSAGDCSGSCCEGGRGDAWNQCAQAQSCASTGPPPPPHYWPPGAMDINDDNLNCGPGEEVHNYFVAGGDSYILCETCEAGKYQERSSHRSACESCSNGQTSASGSTSSSDCLSDLTSSGACHAASGDDWWCAATWGDSLCDEQCNNAACGYDNHDCMSESDVSVCNGEDLMTPCEADSAEDATDSESLEFLRGSCSASCASAYTVFWDLCEIPYTDPASDYWMGTTSVNEFRTFYGVCQDTLNPVVLTEKSSGAAAAAAISSSAAVLLAMMMTATWMMPAV